MTKKSLRQVTQARTAPSAFSTAPQPGQDRPRLRTLAAAPYSSNPYCNPRKVCRWCGVAPNRSNAARCSSVPYPML